jgi:multiple sugar transport system ATP-binding protein
MATIELTGIQKTYGTVDVIGGIDLTVHDREFVVFVGPSGCGKSTLLRMIAGLEDITGGELRIDGALSNMVPPDRRGLAMVFQSYALYPHMTVADNMALALRLAKVPKPVRDAKVQNAARILQLEPLLDRKPGQLSGGQRQRVAIGRAIVREPKAFLFDEPLSNLDAALRVAMRLQIGKLHRDLKATTIYVTHDQIEAMTLADRIVVLNRGRIEQIGTPLELYRTPANLFVAGFIGSPKMNLLPATVAAAGEGRITCVLAGGGQLDLPAEGAASGDRVTVGIRPEHVSVADGGAANGSFEGRVEVIEHLGDETLIYAGVGTEEPLTVKAHAETEVALGEVVRLAVRNDAVIAFDAQGRALPRSRRAAVETARKPAA